MSVTTDYAGTLSSSSITLTGSLDDLHGESSLDVSFEWGASTSYGNETTPASKSSTGSFTAFLDVTSLDEFHDTGQVYCFRAKATNGVDTWYGSNRYFVSLNTCGSDPYIIDNDMDDGTLVDTAVFNDELLLDYLHGTLDSPEFTGAAITGGTVRPMYSDNVEFTGAAITGGTIS